MFRRNFIPMLCIYCDVTVACYIPQLHVLPHICIRARLKLCCEMSGNYFAYAFTFAWAGVCVEPSIQGNIHYTAQCLVFHSECYALIWLWYRRSHPPSVCAQHFYAAAATKQKECSPSINIHFASADVRTLPTISFKMYASNARCAPHTPRRAFSADWNENLWRFLSLEVFELILYEMGHCLNEFPSLCRRRNLFESNSILRSSNFWNPFEGNVFHSDFMDNFLSNPEWSIYTFRKCAVSL